MPNFDLGDYVDVRERLAWFFEKYPDGSLQADILERSEGFVVIKAVAYRSPMDDRPGTGMASEPYPGRTPYTKDSEVMVGETSAWGRALAAIGAPTKGGVASRQEVANRTSPVGEVDVPGTSYGDPPFAPSPTGGTTSGAVAGGESALVGSRPTQEPAPGTTSPAPGPADSGTAGVGTTAPVTAPQAGATMSVANGEVAADREPGEVVGSHSPSPPSPGSTNLGPDRPGPPHYPLTPAECTHLNSRSGRLLGPRKSPRGPVCPRCGLSYITVTEGTAADLGAP